MWIRGAPLIGAVGAYGLALALDRDASDAALAKAHAALDATRPTAVNLRWALDRVRAQSCRLPPAARADAAWREADAIAAEDVAINHAIGEHGLALLRAHRATPARARARDDALQRRRARDLRLGNGDGAPVSRARRRAAGARLGQRDAAADAGRAVSPRGSSPQRGVPHTLFADSASGLLMRRGDVDVVIVGADRVAAQRRRLQQDRHLRQGARRARQRRAVLCRAAVAHHRLGARATRRRDPDRGARRRRSARRSPAATTTDRRRRVAIAPAGTKAVNYAFDVTPARLVTGSRHRARHRARIDGAAIARDVSRARR